MPRKPSRQASSKQTTLDELFMPSSPLKTQTRRRAQPLLTEEGNSSDDDISEIKLEKKAISLSSSSDDDQQPAPSSPARRFAKRRKVTVDSDDEPLAEPNLPPSAPIATNVDANSTDEDAGALPMRRAKQAQRIQDDDSNSDSDEAYRPTRRKLVKGRPPSPQPEDLEDLAKEVDEERILESRLRGRDKRSAFQKNLERLKRKKQGLDTPDSSDGERDEEELTHSDASATPFAGARPDRDGDSDDSEHEDHEEDEDFIVEDDGAELAQLPAEFSMSTHEDLDHQFKKIFQFFVHIAVQPPEERHGFMAHQIKDQQYFSVPLQIVRRKLSGLRDSLVVSSVWRSDFKRMLSTYPDFSLDDLQFAIPQCDACHLGGRLSTLIGRLSGSPYDPMGFQASSNSDTDEDEHPPEFHLGRFCARRTRVFHKFVHWEYSLFEAIRYEIDDLRARQDVKASKRNFIRIAHPGSVQPPEDLTDADAICDYLDSRKVIELQWHEVKSMMESARTLELARAKGDDIDG